MQVHLSRGCTFKPLLSCTPARNTSKLNVSTRRTQVELLLWSVFNSLSGMKRHVLTSENNVTQQSLRIRENFMKRGACTELSKRHNSKQRKSNHLGKLKT